MLEMQKAPSERSEQLSRMKVHASSGGNVVTTVLKKFYGFLLRGHILTVEVNTFQTFYRVIK